MALTKLNNNGIAGVTALPSSIALGDMTLVSATTLSSAASSITFTLADYKEYQFYFVNMHPATDSVAFGFNVSIDNGSNYNVAKTTTNFDSAHNEAGNDTAFGYAAGRDLAQGTGDQIFMGAGANLGADNDQSISGTLNLFNPSSTTFIKHFIGRSHGSEYRDQAWSSFVAGYANTTSALTNIKFQMSSGNIDAGTILMYGIN